MSQPFRYYMQVRYGECDAQKVVFNARYADYIDLAATEFLRSIHDPDQLPNGGFDYQVVKLIIEWKAPARSRDQLEITVRCTQMGNTSFTLSMDMCNAKTGQFLASGEMISVAVHPTTFEKISIPDLMREAMADDGRGQYVDHAGIHRA
ncbi:MAG: thioesterase family protein [Pseudomonas sp.]